MTPGSLKKFFFFDPLAKFILQILSLRLAQIKRSKPQPFMVTVFVYVYRSVVREVDKHMEEGWHVLYFCFFTFI